MCVYVYVCVCMCMHLGMYVCTFMVQCLLAIAPSVSSVVPKLIHKSYTYIHTYIHTYMHTHTYTYYNIHAYIQTYIHTIFTNTVIRGPFGLPHTHKRSWLFGRSSQTHSQTQTLTREKVCEDLKRITKGAADKKELETMLSMYVYIY